ncbi:hypothetical protein FRC18_011942 [Serendipita sp. 400]|nr:hypothetical protein FRC18_011942 [Serendipita sp. 400]
MRAKKTKGQTEATADTGPITVPPGHRSDPIALRTRAGTKSPHKRPTTASLQQARAIRNKRKGKQPVRELSPFRDVPESSTSRFERFIVNQDNDPPPAAQSQLVGRVRVIPEDVIIYSQRRNEDDVDVDPNGVIIDGPGYLDTVRGSLPDLHGPDPDEVQEDDELQEDDSDDPQQEDNDNELQQESFHWPGADGDAEFFEGNTNGNITDITPIARAARIFSMAGITIESPSVHISGRGREPGHQLNTSPEGRASAIVDSAFDILEQHRARRQRPAPRPDALRQAAERINPSGSQGASARAGSSMPRADIGRANQSGSHNADNMSRNGPQRTGGVVLPRMPHLSPSGVRISDAIAVLA